MLAAVRLTACTRSSPRAIVNILRYIHCGVAHVIVRDFGPNADTAHQGRMHRAEAPKIHGPGQTKLLDRGLQMPTQQVAPVYGGLPWRW